MYAYGQRILYQLHVLFLVQKVHLYYEIFVPNFGAVWL